MNKTVWEYIAITLFSISTLAACEPCADCGPENAYPYFTLRILNQTSLDTLKLHQKRIANELDLADSALNNTEDAVKVDSLSNFLVTKSDSLSLINDLISVTNDYLISIESINGLTDLYKNPDGGDSLNQFKIPLNTNQEQANYEIKIEFLDTALNMRIGYQLFDTAINNKITKAAKNVHLLESDFKETRGPVECSPISQCISNELAIYVKI